MIVRWRYARVLPLIVASVFGAGAAAQQDPSTGSGQTFPNKPIRFITPYAPGGSTSFTARLIGQRLTEAWGQPVVVDNRPGANTAIGTAAAVKSRPDGYTIVTLGNTLATNHMSRENALRRTDGHYVYRDGIELREHTGGFADAPGEFGEGADRAGESEAGASHVWHVEHRGSDASRRRAFQFVADIRTRQIPYKGGGPAVSDLLGGHIDFFMSNPANVASQIRSGRLRALAVTGESRVSTFPDVPTFAEEGMPEITLTNWQGVGGPAGIPKTIVDKIAAEIRRIVALPDTKEKLNAQGFEPFYNSAERTTAMLRSDIDKYAKIIKHANIKAD